MTAHSWKPQCPACGSTRTRVRYSRWHRKLCVTVRFRICLRCAKRFRTQSPAETVVTAERQRSA